jgi:hypothetical protein
MLLASDFPLYFSNLLVYYYKVNTFQPIVNCPFIISMLKVPKREIFDSSDNPDFYTIKSLREGDFGVKI